MKVRLLGSNGFVGTNVAEEFKEKGIEFFPVSRKYGFDLRRKEDNIRFIKESGCTVIVNCAAHVGSLNYVAAKAADVISDNTRMILSLYESVQEAAPEITIINPIANCAFPSKALLFKEDELWDGALHPSVMSYGFTRRLIIATAECFKIQYGIKSVNLFTPNMYGPNDSTDPNKAHALNALVSKFVKAGNEGKNEVEVWGSGIVIREWLYAKDFARIICCILNNLEKNHMDCPVNIAQNSGLSIRELVDLIIKSFDFKGEVVWNKSMPDGALKKVMDDTLFRKKFPEFQFTPLEKGIQETTQYYLSQYPY